MKVSLAFPFYNEEANAKAAVEGLYSAFSNSGLDFELVLVDNGSSDKTGEILNSFAKKHRQVKTVRVPVNQGYGYGIIQGMNAGTGDYIGFSDGDNQIPPEDLVSVCKSAVKNKDDVAKSLRTRRYDGIKRKLISAGMNSLFSLLFLHRIRDMNGKPKLMRKSCFRELNITSKDWFIDAEVILKSLQKGYKIGEYPIEFRKRERGQSKIRSSSIFEFLGNIFAFRIKPKKWK